MLPLICVVVEDNVQLPSENVRQNCSTGCILEPFLYSKKDHLATRVKLQEMKMSAAKLHMIGNAHLDPVWLWRWPEGMSEARATFSSALERMEETPGFVFTASAAALYEWIERTDPDLFKRIQEKVTAGRWSIVGGWQTQSDCNIPGGEAFARNALYSQRWFRQKFGSTCRTGYCVDSFGHADSLPQLLKLGGMTSYVFMRPMIGENPGMPEGPFVWEGSDGTRIPCYRIYSGYGCDSLWALNKQLKTLAQKAPRLAMCFYGVGDHGGGPTKEMLNHIEKLRSEGQLLAYSTPDSYFEELAPIVPELPVWKGELQIHAVGCYAAESRIKRANRRAEWQLLAAERLAAAAQLITGSILPTARIEAAWKDVLFCQFHDVLAGTCVVEACDESLEQYGRAIQSSSEILNESVQLISRHVDTTGEGSAIIVFNPHAFPVRTLVESDDMFVRPWSEDESAAHLRNADGTMVPIQAVRTSARAFNARMIFPVALPALGWQMVRFILPKKAGNDAPPGVPPVVGPLPGILAVEADRMENEHVRLTVDKAGRVSIFDKATAKEILAGGGTPLVIDDPSDTWSHDVTRYDKEAGVFRMESCDVLESGPLRAKLRLKFVFGLSRLTMDHVLERNSRSVLIDATIDWHEQLKLLKLVFPVPFASPTWTTETPYGEIVRELTGTELPMQSWTDLSDPDAGLAIANDSKYGLDARNGSLRITILRSPAYAHHDPAKLLGDERFIDQGIQKFRLLLIPHGADWRPLVSQQAHLLNCPPVVSREGTHPGRINTAPKSLVEVDGKGVLVTVLKRAEDGSAWILRAFQTAATAERATIRIPQLCREWSADFRPGEIKTFVIPDDGRKITEASFLEEA
ncbi:MAG: alpha-mannosidase [Verrucomicrobia bacterium]|nr:alpha-mannosidase [Verrucomicrobiota bacterium]